MIVHGYFRSSAAYRLRIALNLKGLAPEARFVHLRRGDQKGEGYRALNPQGLVPALETDDGRVLTQSLAIVEWLDESFPEPPLLPADRDARARARAFALAIACDIHPLQNLRVLRYLKAQYGQEQDGLDAWCRHWVGEGLAAFLDRIALHPRYGAFSEGVVALDDLAYFAGVALVALALARFSFDLRRIGS